MPVKVTEYKDSTAIPARTAVDDIIPSWQDTNIKVWALPIAPTGQSQDGDMAQKLALNQSKYDAHLNNSEGLQAPASETPEERETRYDRIRTQVIEHMFNSTWKFDTLVEKHISEIEMPTAIYVRNPQTHQIESYTGPVPGGEVPLPDIKVLTRTPWPGALVQALPPSRVHAEAVSYIIKSFPMRGKFDVQRAKQLGVKPGLDFGALTKGESVQSVDGKTVTPDMVMGADRPGQGAAIFDLPSIEYLDPLLAREELASKNLMQDIRLCVWILGPGISESPTFQAFIQKLSYVQHVISSADHCPNRLSLDSVAAQTIRLKQIDPHRYSVPFHDVTTLPQVSFRDGTQRSGASCPPNALVAERGLRFRLMPHFEMQKGHTPPLLDVSKVEGSTSPEIIKLAKVANWDSLHDEEPQQWKQKIPRPETEITTLGTGSALPSKYRNVSATLVRVPGVGNYLLDCGENTLGQLQRVFNPDELREILRDLRMIWISHLHADHHLGTTSLIKAWYAVKHNSIPASDAPHMPTVASSAPMYGLSVVSNEGMLKWLYEYSDIEDFGYSRIIPLHVSPSQSGSNDEETSLWLCPHAEPGSYTEHALRRKDYETVLGLSDVDACFVSHCRGAMAVTLTFPVAQADAEAGTGPLKVSYSGDCRPSRKFARIGRGTTVLVHEATFDDELIGDAKAKKHSTTSEALNTGASMGAKAVVLTHFSQRYQKIPVLQSVEGDWEEDELAAEDVDDEPAAEQDIDPTTEAMDIETQDSVDVFRSISSNSHSQSFHHEQIIKVRAKDMKVAIAFDYMRVKIGDIAQLEKFTPALSRLLAHEADGDAGAASPKRNSNGKKTSDGEGGGKKKKSKRNN